jgi:hypothetical protein
MSEIGTIQLSDLTIEVEVFSTINGPVDTRDCFITVRAPTGFEVDDCRTEQQGRKTTIMVTMAHEHTAEEERFERGDFEYHLHKDEGT